MEQFEERWAAVETMLHARFGKTPDLQAILFLVGINELGQLPERKSFTKEQKQDLMHVAVCTLLSQEGYFQFSGRDDDGWPHFEPVRPVAASGLEQQERLIQECIIRYFGC